MRLLLIALAGALGTLARYGVTVAAASWTKGGFPLGTLIVNVTGSLLIGALYALVSKNWVSEETRWILGAGFLGGFTTFSAFTLEAQQLLSNGQRMQSMLYLGGNLLLGFAAVIAGLALGGMVARA